MAKAATQGGLLPSEREALLAELARRQGIFTPPAAASASLANAQEAFLADLHPKQLEFVQDPSKRKIASTGRRGGKTYSLLYLTMRAIRQYPGATIPYIGLSKDQCRRNFFKPLQTLNGRYQLGLEFNKQRMIATAPNGSEIILVGAKDSDDLDKLRGDKYPLVMIDEAGSFGEHLEELVEDVLDAALGDYDGTVVMTSSPPLVPAGFFYEAANDVRPGWAKFHWTVLDNSKFQRWAGKPDWQEQAKAYLASKAAQFGAESPKFKREYLGQFAYDTTSLYFKFEAARNTYDALPKHEWYYLLGVDFGYTDNTAFVVLAVSPYSDKIYVVETYAAPKMLDTEIVAKITELASRYPFVKKVADFAAKQFVVTLNVRYSLGLTAADKGDRLAQIELLNSDFLTGRLLVSARETEFQNELATTNWNAEHTGPAPTRHLGHHADRHDALRYVWNAAQPYRGKLVGEDGEHETPKTDVQTWTDDEAARVAALERQYLAQQSGIGAYTDAA